MLTIKSLDLMKWAKDTLSSQPSDSEIDNLVTFLASNFSLTHLGISVPMDSQANFKAFGNNPSPRSIEDFTKKWFDAIHAKGLGVLFRGTLCETEGIYNAPFTKRTPAQWYALVTDFIARLGSSFTDKDIFAPFPESTGHAFDGKLFIDLPNGTQSYADFFTGLQDRAQASFATVGKQVSCGYSSNNFTEIKSGWIPQSLFNKANIVCMDHYGGDDTSSDAHKYTPGEMDEDLHAIAQAKNLPVFLQEWGLIPQMVSKYPGTQALAEFVTAMTTVWDKAITDNILKGVNYWIGRFQNTPDAIFFNDGSGNWVLNDNGKAIQAFFARHTGGTPTPVPVPPAPPVPGILVIADGSIISVPPFTVKVTGISGTFNDAKKITLQIAGDIQ